MTEIANNLHLYIITIGLILLFSTYASKISDKIGVPLLLVFLGIGMLLGSDGIGGIEFDNPTLTQIISTIALIFILYYGGLSTSLKDIKPVISHGIALATIGVVLTMIVMACFIYLLLDFSFLESMLLGAIISSTDAAAVFMILKSKTIKLKNNIGELLELESGSNDPMAIFLSIAILQLIFMPNENTMVDWIIYFIKQFTIGGAIGIICGYLFPKICDKIKLSQIGLYPLISISWVFIIFGLSVALGGNGYLSIYIAGILTNSYEFPNKQNITSFHDSIAWLMQVLVFLLLGLLVFPSDLKSVALESLILTFILIVFARPFSIFATLIKSKYNTKEKIYISWVGLRGAVPIILATYPYTYGLQSAHSMFNIVFFMVLISVLVQGMSLSFMAKKLNLVE